MVSAPFCSRPFFRKNGRRQVSRGGRAATKLGRKRRLIPAVGPTKFGSRTPAPRGSSRGLEGWVLKVTLYCPGQGTDRHTSVESVPVERRRPPQNSQFVGIGHSVSNEVRQRLNLDPSTVHDSSIFLSVICKFAKLTNSHANDIQYTVDLQSLSQNRHGTGWGRP